MQDRHDSGLTEEELKLLRRIAAQADETSIRNDERDEIQRTEKERLQRLIYAVDDIERLLKSYERTAWLWTTIGIWVKWFGVVGASLIALKLLWTEVKEVIRLMLVP
jgi:hypothetical protein